MKSHRTSGLCLSRTQMTLLFPTLITLPHASDHPASTPHIPKPCPGEADLRLGTPACLFTFGCLVNKLFLFCKIHHFSAWHNGGRQNRSDWVARQFLGLLVPRQGINKQAKVIALSLGNKAGVVWRGDGEGWECQVESGQSRRDDHFPALWETSEDSEARCVDFVLSLV